MLIPGPDLTERQRAQVLAAFVHRHTVIGPGRYYQSDADWLNTHTFHFTKNGARLSANRRFAEPYYGRKTPNQIAIEHNKRVRQAMKTTARGINPAPYRCPACGQWWKTKKALRAHLEWKHRLGSLYQRNAPSFRYVYRPGVLDLASPTVMRGRPIPPHTLVRVLAKRPAGGRAIRGWARTFAWIMDIHGNEQIVFRRALQKTSATGY